MNLFAISGLSVGIPCVILAAITFAFGRTRLHRCLMNFNLIVSVWGFGLFLAGIADSHEKALFAWQIAHAGGFFVGPAFYHFASVFTGDHKKKLLVFSYVQAGICVLFTFGTDLVLNKTRYVYGLHYIQTTPFHITGLAAYLTFVCISYWKLIAFLPQTHGHKRQQTQYIIFGFMFGFTGATTTFLPMFGIDLLYPFGNFGITVYSIIVTYAILRHNLLDIHLAFRRGLAYSLSAGILTGLFIVLVLTLTRLFSFFTGIDSSTISAVSALAIALMFKPLKNRIQLLIDKLFNKTAIDYYAVIREVSNELASSINLKHICAFIADTAFSTFKLKNTCLLAANADHYEPMYVRLHSEGAGSHDNHPSTYSRPGLLSYDFSKGPDSENAGIHLKNGSHLIRILKDRKKSIALDESEDDKSGEMTDIISCELAPFQGKVAVPIFVDNRLAFLLVLGEKLSGDVFSAGDMSMLDTLANQAAISLKNALLYDNLEMRVEERTRELGNAYSDLKATQSQMLQREKMASIGQLAAGVAHEINNPTGFILSNLGTLSKYTDKMIEYINAQTEAIASLKVEDISNELRQKRQKLKLDYVLQDIKELVRESVDGADRIKKIVQNLKSFSRVDEAEYKPADINECIESTLNIVWNELKYNSTVEKEYGSIPLTKCYPHQLNQVFMNLLVNAAHAIEKQGLITIKTWNGDGSINISISDTGCGIPEDKMGRIFEPFFTTKEVGKGTGLGLSISYDILKKHNGQIIAESKVGKGTTFTVKIPLIEVS